MLGFRGKLKKASRREEEEFRKRLQEEKVDKKDAWAMAIAAFLTIVLPCLLVLLVIGGIILLLF
jgi:fatty-acid desaturase